MEDRSLNIVRAHLRHDRELAKRLAVGIARDVAQPLIPNIARSALPTNGSGKSTVLDALAFLTACFEFGLRHAWNAHGCAKGLKTHGCQGPVVIEIEYRESHDQPVITYHLAVDAHAHGPIVVEEWMSLGGHGQGRAFKFLEYRAGEGEAVGGRAPDARGRRIPIRLTSPDLLAVNALGGFAEHPHIAALRDCVTRWHFPDRSAETVRGLGEQEKPWQQLIEVIRQRDDEHLSQMIGALRERAPHLVEALPDGRLALKLNNSPFDEPARSGFISDGTLKILAYLILLRDPEPPPFIGIEPPETSVHPRLLPRFAEEFRRASERTQLLVTTHSPLFLNGLRPEEVRLFWRDEQGEVRTQRVSDLDNIRAFIEEGASLGSLWAEGHFGLGDPLTDGSAPSEPADDGESWPSIRFSASRAL